VRRAPESIQAGSRAIRRWASSLVLAAIACSAAIPPAESGSEFDLVWLKPATAAPDFAVASLSSAPLTLRQFRGKILLLNFWATWCEPCREEMPALERLYQRYRNAEFSIVAISADRQATVVAPYVAALRLSFPIGLDPGMDVAKRYTARALPSSFLIDKSGRILAFAIGPRAWDNAHAHAVIERLLK
jgi:thiol-disulfide isomerase/thioredoxin